MTKEETNQDFVRRVVQENEVPDDFFLALGWAIGECCSQLNEGRDPRSTDMEEILIKALRDIYGQKETNDD